MEQVQPEQKPLSVMQGWGCSSWARAVSVLPESLSQGMAVTLSHLGGCQSQGNQQQDGHSFCQRHCDCNTALESEALTLALLSAHFIPCVQRQVRPSESTGIRELGSVLLRTQLTGSQVAGGISAIAPHWSDW